MRDNIELFLNTMDDILSTDLKKHIAEIINIKNNIKIIRQQKDFKYKLNVEILKLFNTCYFDSNFSIYKNNRNQLVFENISLGNNQVYLFANNNQPLTLPDTQLNDNNDNNDNQLVRYNDIANNISNGNSQLVLNNTIHEPHNEIILFDNDRLVTSGENGEPIRRRIKLYVVYI